jgi:hypothetical protein
MRGRIRHILIGLGVLLMGVGWVIISQPAAQQDLAEHLGPVLVERAANDAAAVNVRDIVLRTAATPYAAGLLAVIGGAIVIGFNVPRGQPSPRQRRGRRRRDDPTPLHRRPWALLIATAVLLLLFGLFSAIADSTHGRLLPGLRSAVALLVCAGLTALMPRVRVVGLGGYYVGLTLTALLGLNFLRLAAKTPLNAGAVSGRAVLIALMGVICLGGVLLLWRAIPGGLDRARAILHLRRLGMAGGAAAIVAGICLVKTSIPPQHATAELDGAAEQERNVERGETTPSAQPSTDPKPEQQLSTTHAQGADNTAPDVAVRIRPSREHSNDRPPLRFELNPAVLDQLLDSLPVLPPADDAEGIAASPSPPPAASPDSPRRSSTALVLPVRLSLSTRLDPRIDRQPVRSRLDPGDAPQRRTRHPRVATPPHPEVPPLKLPLRPAWIDEPIAVALESGTCSHGISSPPDATNHEAEPSGDPTEVAGGSSDGAKRLPERIEPGHSQPAPSKALAPPVPNDERRSAPAVAADDAHESHGAHDHFAKRLAFIAVISGALVLLASIALRWISRGHSTQRSF